MDAGVALRLPIIDSTPVLNGRRGHEIAHWLAAHPEVTTWAIVDDDSDMLPEQRHRFVQTDFSDGLSFRGYLDLCNAFGVSPTGGKAARGDLKEYKDRLINGAMVDGKFDELLQRVTEGREG